MLPDAGSSARWITVVGSPLVDFPSRFRGISQKTFNYSLKAKTDHIVGSLCLEETVIKKAIVSL